MKLEEAARFGHRGLAHRYRRYGRRRQLWIADLSIQSKMVQSLTVTDENGDPLFRLESLTDADHAFTDWLPVREGEQK